jgi:hypothetical protein
VPEIVRLEKNPSTAQPMQLYTMSREADPIGTVAMVARDHINAATVTSWMMSDYRWIPEGRSISHVIIQGSVLTHQRNEAIQRMQGDWLLYIDDDMVWQPDAIGRLVDAREEFDLDMIGGLCFRRSEPHQPTMFMREEHDNGKYNFVEKWDEDEIREVDATGAAFLLIHKRVFEMIAGGEMPPYEIRAQEGGPPPNFFKWEGTLGEDLRFCQDAKAAGARIFVHTGIQIGHVAEKQLGYEDFLFQLARRDEATMEARRNLNDSMGLPTMTPEEAREKLGWA